MKMWMPRNPLVLAALVLAIASSAAFGQAAPSYPSRLLRLVVGSAPGGAMDVIGRIVSSRLSEELGQSIVVDNRAGAAGNIAVEIAARANPDGYTIMVGNIGLMAINPIFYPNFPVKPTRDFVAVSQVVDVPSLMFTNPALPIKSLKQLIEYGRANPGKINVSSGAANRLDLEFFMQATGIKMVMVLYKGGAGPVITGVLSNEISLALTSLSSSIGLARAGKLQALAVMAPKRWAALPEVPTFAESGISGMATGQWQGLFVPAGTPRPIVNSLYSAVVKVMELPDVKERIINAGAEIVISKSPEDFAAFVRSENARLAKVAMNADLMAK